MNRPGLEEARSVECNQLCLRRLGLVEPLLLLGWRNGSRSRPDHLDPEEADHRLGQRLVVGVAAAADRHRDTLFRQPLGAR